MKVPNTVQFEKKTIQDKKGPLPWDDFMGNDFGFSYQREDKIKMNKEKNQVTTSAGKKDDTDSIVTKTTATFTSNCKLDWDEYTARRNK